MESSYKPKGFVNSRNACFLNSAMQLLGAIDALRTHVAECAGPFSEAFKESLLVTNLLEPSSAFWQVTELFLGYTPRVIRQNCAGDVSQAGSKPRTGSICARRRFAPKTVPEVSQHLG